MAAMRAVVMRNSELVIDDLPDPEPGPGEILVRTLACGICSADVQTLNDAQGWTDQIEDWGESRALDPAEDLVLGHEFCGEVLEYGPQTSNRLKRGTRMVAMPVLMRPGRVAPIGLSNDTPGGYAELMLISEPLAMPVPNGLPSEIAALTEPMANGIHAVGKARLRDDDSPLVIGCGPAGLAVIAALKGQTAQPIVAADLSPLRRQLALHMGADFVVDPRERSPFEVWKDLAGTRPAVIFECTGVHGMLQKLISGAPREASIVAVGICAEDDTYRPITAISKELCVQFVLGYTPAEFNETLRRIAEGQYDVEPLITARVGMEGVGGAFLELEKPDVHAKIMLDPTRK
jgi:threonine dehydrogenase-like Zn-dependent dehydrogenase